jgi:hypothetical protein
LQEDDDDGGGDDYDCDYDDDDGVGDDGGGDDGDGVGDDDGDCGGGGGDDVVFWDMTSYQLPRHQVHQNHQQLLSNPNGITLHKTFIFI